MFAFLKAILNARAAADDFDHHMGGEPLYGGIDRHWN